MAVIMIRRRAVVRRTRSVDRVAADDDRGRVGVDEPHDAADVGALGRVLLVGELSASGSAVHQGASAHRDQRRAAREHAARRAAFRALAAAPHTRRVDGRLLRDRAARSSGGDDAAEAICRATSSSSTDARCSTGSPTYLEHAGALSGAVARRGRARFARRCPRRRRPTAESLDDDSARFRDDDRPGNHALESPVVLRLLRDVVVGAGNSRRDADRDARREGDAVEDVAGGDGARAGRDGLAASDARPERRLVRHDDRHGVDLDDARRSPPRARRSPELAIRERGMAGRADLPRLRVYASAHAHSSIDKAAIALGLGLENRRHDAERRRHFECVPTRSPSAIASDRAQGFVPLACVATVGTTSTASIDPVPAIAEICRREGVWLHVDGAYGGVLAIAPEFRWVLDGVDGADSLRRESAQVAVHALRLLGALPQARRTCSSARSRSCRSISSRASRTRS